MAKIGSFTKNGEAFLGTIQTLMFKAEVEIIAVEKTTEKAPDYRIYTNSFELGAGWDTISDQGTEYIAVKLDDPSFKAPIFASLFKAEGYDYSLMWQRPKAR